MTFDQGKGVHMFCAKHRYVFPSTLMKTSETVEERQLRLADDMFGVDLRCIFRE
jgi:hypothetical protein